MTPEKKIDYIFCLFIGTFYIYALTRTLFSATVLPISQGTLFLAGFFSIVIFLIIVYNSATRITTLLVVVAIGLYVAYLARSTPDHRLLTHFYDVAQMIISGVAYYPELARTVVWGVSLFLGFVVVVFMFLNFNFYTLTLTGVAMFIFTWGPGFTRERMGFFLALFVFCVILIRKMNNSPKVTMMIAAPLCALAILMGHLQMPDYSNLFERRPLNEFTTRTMDAVGDLMFEVFNPTYFSFQATGFAGAGGRLGGAVTPNNRTVMDVYAPGRIYLIGAVSNTYTGYSWRQTIEPGEIYTHGLPPSQFEMLENAAALMRSASFADEWPVIPPRILTEYLPRTDVSHVNYRQFPTVGVAQMRSYYLYSYLPINTVTIDIGRQRTGTVFRPPGAWGLTFAEESTDYLQVLNVLPTGDMQTPRIMSRGTSYSMQFLNVNHQLVFMEHLLREMGEGIHAARVADAQQWHTTFGGQVMGITPPERSWYFLQWMDGGFAGWNFNDADDFVDSGLAYYVRFEDDFGHWYAPLDSVQDVINFEELFHGGFTIAPNFEDIVDVFEVGRNEVLVFDVADGFDPLVAERIYWGLRSAIVRGLPIDMTDEQIRAFASSRFGEIDEETLREVTLSLVYNYAPNINLDDFDITYDVFREILTVALHRDVLRPGTENEELIEERILEILAATTVPESYLTGFIVRNFEGEIGDISEDFPSALFLGCVDDEAEDVFNAIFSQDDTLHTVVMDASGQIIAIGADAAESDTVDIQANPAGVLFFVCDEDVIYGTMMATVGQTTGSPENVVASVFVMGEENASPIRTNTFRQIHFVPWDDSRVLGTTRWRDYTAFGINDLQVLLDLFIDSRLHYIPGEDYLLRWLDAVSVNVFADYAQQVRRHYMEVPDIVPERVHDLTMEIIAHADNDFDRVMAIRDYLMQFRYTLDPIPVPRGVCFVDHFLFVGQAGYCTYFASAMAVMARIAGVPSRYVEGFVIPPSHEEMAVVTVTNLMAHAWVEVYLEGFGWMTVEATPTYAFIMDALRPLPRAAGAGTDNPFMDDPRWWMGDDMDEWMIWQVDRIPGEGTAIAAVQEERPGRAERMRVNIGAVLLTVVILALVGLVALAVVRIWRVRRGLVRVRGLCRNGQTIAFFRGLFDMVEHFALPPNEGETLKAYAARNGNRFSFKSDSLHLGDLTALYYKATYSPHEITENERALMEAAYFDMVTQMKYCDKRYKFVYRRYVQQIGALNV